MECVDNSFLRLVDQFHFMVVLVSLAFAAIAKDKKWVVFTAVVAFFYFLSVHFHCEIKANDPEFIWRYVIWCVLACLAGLVTFILKSMGRVYFAQALMFIVLSALEAILQSFRMIDIHFFNNQYSSLLYKSGMPMLNNLAVICCMLPLIIVVKRIVKKWIYHLD
ncbi:hypothetical protein TW73_08910 [Pseudoalteromonas piscicida]|nr:hypothetical protein TW73_08910 [Pseudoalteromonas piscicida]